MIAGQAKLARIVNRRYWHSSDSVNRIAESLDLSKGALYDLIQPVPAQGACPDCGASLSFANRTTRDRGLAECVDCSLSPGSGDEAPSAAPRPHPGLVPASRPSRAWHGPALAGSLLLGIAAGLLIARFIRRK